MGSGLLPSNTHEKIPAQGLNSATRSEFFYSYTMCAICRNLINETGSRRSPPSFHRCMQLSLSEGSNRKVPAPIT